jgi:hypothetical protein
MRIGILGVLLVGIVSVGLAHPKEKQAPAPPPCQDEETMVGDYTKDLTSLTATVKGEDLTAFQRAFHRKTCLTKLTLCVPMLDGAAACFEKAASDPATPKDQVQAIKAKHDQYVKLKEKVGHYRDTLKATQAYKEAKALIEQFDFSN